MRGLLIACLLLSASLAKAQGDMSLGSIDVQQRTGLNPSFIPDNEWSIGLPIVSSVSFSGASSRFPLSDFIRPHPDSAFLMVDARNIVDRVPTRAYFHLGSSHDWLSIGKKIGDKNYLRFSLRDRLDLSANIPQNLLLLMAEGNAASLLDRSMTFESFALEFNWLREYAFSYARRFGDQLNVGVSAKLIQGISNLNAMENNLVFTTEDPFYDMSLMGSFSYQTSNTEMLRQGNEWSLFSKTPLWSTNFGFGFDLGMSYAPNDKIELGLSVLDIGTVTWKARAQEHMSTFDTLNYSGLNLLDLFGNEQGGTSPDAQSFVADSLVEIFEIQSQNSSYTSSLPLSMNGFFSYQLSEKNTAFVSFRSVKRAAFWQSSVQLAFNRKFSEKLQMGFNYAAGTNGLLNVGIQGTIELGPAQVYLCVDNLPGLFLPQEVRYWSSRTGINLIF